MHWEISWGLKTVRKLICKCLQLDEKICFLDDDDDSAPAQEKEQQKLQQSQSQSLYKSSSSLYPKRAASSESMHAKSATSIPTAEDYDSDATEEDNRPGTKANDQNLNEDGGAAENPPSLISMRAPLKDFEELILQPGMISLAISQSTLALNFAGLPVLMSAFSVGNDT